MSLAVILILVWCVVRTLSFSKWCFENGKISGGISVIFLCSTVVLSGMVILR